MTGGSSGGPVVTDYPHNAYSYGYTFEVASVTYVGTPATTGQATFGDTEQRLYNKAPPGAGHNPSIGGHPTGYQDCIRP